MVSVWLRYGFGVASVCFRCGSVSPAAVVFLAFLVSMGVADGFCESPVQVLRERWEASFGSMGIPAHLLVRDEGFSS